MLTCIVHRSLGPLISYIALHIYFVPVCLVLHYALMYLLYKDKRGNRAIVLFQSLLTIEGEKLEICIFIYICLAFVYKKIFKICNYELSNFLLEPN